MDPGRLEAQNYVAGRYGGAVYDLFTLDSPDAETCQVVLAFLVHGGHRGRFASEQGAPSHLATESYAFDDLFNNARPRLADGDIVKEEKRLGAASHHIIGVHGDQVDTDGVVLVQSLGDLYFGADAVGSRGKDHLSEPEDPRVKQPGKPPDPGDDARPVCPGGDLGYPPHVHTRLLRVDHWVLPPSGHSAGHPWTGTG